MVGVNWCTKTGRAIARLFYYQSMLKTVKYWVALFKEVVNAYEEISTEYNYYPLGGNPNEKKSTQKNVNSGS